MNEKVLSAKESALGFVLSFAFSQVAVLVFTLVGSLIATMFGVNLTKFESFLNNAVGYFILMLFFDAALLGVFVIFNKGKQNSVVSKPSALKILLYAGISAVAFFTLYPIIVCLDSLFVKLGAELSEIPYRLTGKNFIFSLFSFAILPAFCEELLFRGLIFKGLKRYGKAFSIIISAVMFAVFHMSYQQFAYPLFMGLLLGVVMYYENNIIYTITIHLVNNLLSLMLSYLKIDLFINHWAYILLAVALLIIFIAIISYFIFNKKNVALKEKVGVVEKRYLIISFAIMIFLWVIINLYNRLI